MADSGSQISSWTAHCDRRAMVCIVLLATMLGAGRWSVQTALAQSASAVTAEDIVKALELPSTEGIQLRGGRQAGINRGLVVRRSINLEIPFAFNAATPTLVGFEMLRELGHALSDARLARARFRIAGHTDAIGSELYNERLSERRAAFVRAWLIREFRIPPHRVEAVGMGETALRDPANPGAPSNRRVEITSIGEP